MRCIVYEECESHALARFILVSLEHTEIQLAALLSSVLPLPLTCVRGVDVVVVVRVGSRHYRGEGRARA